MARPDPYLYAPDFPSKERAFRALYAAGYTCGGTDLEAVLDHMRTDFSIGRYDHVCHTRWGVGLNEGYPGVEASTLVNSLPHMLSYLRRPT